MATVLRTPPLRVPITSPNSPPKPSYVSSRQSHSHSATAPHLTQTSLRFSYLPSLRSVKFLPLASHTQIETTKEVQVLFILSEYFFYNIFAQKTQRKQTFIFEVRLFADDKLISRLPRNQTCHKFLTQNAVITEMQLARCLKIGTQTSLKHSFLVGGNFMETNSVQCTFFCI